MCVERYFSSVTGVAGVGSALPVCGCGVQQHVSGCGEDWRAANWGETLWGGERQHRPNQQDSINNPG